LALEIFANDNSGDDAEEALMADDQLPAERKQRGAYAVSARLAKVLTLLASGKTQLEACAAVGFTPRALQFALKKQSVKTYMQQVVMRELGLTGMRAAKRIAELLHSSNEMVAFNASRYALATGLQIAPPDQRGPLVAVNVDASPGFVIDLHERDDGGVTHVSLGPAGGMLGMGRRTAAPPIDVTPTPEEE
jgi:hypothetical protein